MYDYSTKYILKYLNINFVFIYINNIFKDKQLKKNFFISSFLK